MKPQLDSYDALAPQFSIEREFAYQVRCDNRGDALRLCLNRGRCTVTNEVTGFTYTVLFTLDRGKYSGRIHRGPDGSRGADSDMHDNHSHDSDEKEIGAFFN